MYSYNKFNTHHCHNLCTEVVSCSICGLTSLSVCMISQDFYDCEVGRPATGCLTTGLHPFLIEFFEKHFFLLVTDLRPTGHPREVSISSSLDYISRFKRLQSNITADSAIPFKKRWSIVSLHSMQ